MSVPGPPQGWPQQPHQGYYPPQQPYPGHYPPPGPLTKAGWGAVPAALGCVLELVALFAVPWVTFTQGDQSATFTFLDFVGKAGGNPFAGGFGGAYVKVLAFLATAATLFIVLTWTLGALRTKRSAYLLSGIRRKELTHTHFGWYRTVFTGRAVVMLIIHVAGVLALFSGHLDMIGIGPWLMFAGGALAVVGAAIGPTKAPAMQR